MMTWVSTSYLQVYDRSKTDKNYWLPLNCLVCIPGIDMIYNLIGMILDDWLSLPSVLGSEYASPAAKRLCLTLLFVALALSPELNDKQDSWVSLQQVYLLRRAVKALM